MYITCYTCIHLSIYLIRGGGAVGIGTVVFLVDRSSKLYTETTGLQSLWYHIIYTPRWDEKTPGPVSNILFRDVRHFHRACPFSQF